jgi:hypothetical protein
MSIGDLYIFCSLPQSLSSVVCSYCRYHLHLLLTLFLGIEAIVNRIFFLYSFLICPFLLFRKATDFSKLILHPATLLKLFMVSRSFLGL